MKQNAGFYIYSYMLEFKQDDTSIALILTLTELVSLPNPYFLFVFTHVITKDAVAFLKSGDDDESDYPDRFNQYTVNPADLFGDAPVGEWHYKIYEQEDNANLDPSLSGAVLEYGKMILDRDEEFAFAQYDSPTAFKTYNG